MSNILNSNASIANERLRSIALLVQALEWYIQFVNLLVLIDFVGRGIYIVWKKQTGLLIKAEMKAAVTAKKRFN